MTDKTAGPSEIKSGSANTDSPTPTSDREQIVHIDRITNVRFPPFWRNKPNLWFLQIEGLMRKAKITRDNLKLEELVCNLDADIMSIIEDILEGPPEEQNYQKAKERIIRIFSDSEESKVRTLLQGLTLGDSKPSELLRKMRSLAGGEITEDFLKNMWVQRLPTDMQQILTVNPGTLNNMAEQADKIADISVQLNISAVSASATQKSDGFAQIKKRMDEFAQTLLKIQKQLGQRTRSVSRGRSATPTRNANEKKSSLCYFHKKFGDKATKCKDPCDFSLSGN